MQDFDFVAGETVLVDKPLEWTSFGVVKKLRWEMKVKKVGHAGTLDPLATGLLILCTGKSTKTIDQIQGKIKEYEGEMVIGATTASYDLETEVENQVDISHITEQNILDLLPQFTGKIMQVPPMHSAIKVNGVRVYKHARKGKEVKIDPREVEISELEITKIDFPKIQFRMVCSKGTYVRSFVKDFGDALGVGAYMSGLRRTKIGEYDVKDAKSVEEWIEVIREWRSNQEEEENSK
ncbi:tRNA pseudouridine(55) synthase TruB [Flammeovirga kamogawensis]|uniref:tRNA pseudouridine synthase B n=1 Tax=Flammeovirga kamogawensis TaxID=373891 RepID=A0ABX8GZH6_9BACT|nr:tRNA pseudouridine(55) synthase TruB [Flammeovirga kamogawensis]MBB6459461.1 tRNA pseudouridine55 synthase [Flammeovirga kamogawensis]QWG09013.1 tRNA pseudouridine(55) synthase TruB [Flammeovirga kamogawensis]TRX67301.1 tRNA pseudouridine(55) synthase TruB [Flammeovirga kamogawensis]